MSQESPNLSLHNANFGIFIARMVPEIFAFLGTDTARPDFEITTFIFTFLNYGENKESHVFTIDNTIVINKKRSQFTK